MESIQRYCPVCGWNNGAFYLEKRELRLVKCGECGMVYANPVPAKYIDGSYYEDAGRPFYLSPAKLQADYSPVRFAREIRIFRKFCNGGRVLDVGCSTGGFLHSLRTRFPGEYESFGTDISGPAVDYAEAQGIKILKGNFLDENFGRGEFDIITFWAVLEHVAEPGLFLKRASEMLKAGGLCFVLVPNFKSLAVRILKGKYRYILGQHLNYFTRETLERCAGNWFERVYYTGTHFNPVVIWYDWKGKEPPTEQQRAKLLEKTTKLKERQGIGAIKVMYALSEGLLRTFNLADNCLLVLRN